ncbi:hypothetical protein DUI87_09520 [Hirundo rustica rustica]|uniref:Uncharacterized protein n=1 Tax=Hirundo rustica rustica TaxID=333673 RepID=A0A3M0KSS2_HIRRU|nr:hypothetical protein DUI87_09520 [Hirundo rustica rustica]
MVKRVVAIPTDAGRAPSHLPTSFSHKGENKPWPLAASRRTGSLTDVHRDVEPQGCRDAMDSFQRKGETVHTPPGTPSSGPAKYMWSLGQFSKKDHWMEKDSWIDLDRGYLGSEKASFI